MRTIFCRSETAVPITCARAAVSFEDCKRALGARLLDHVAEADAHVEDLVHLAVVDARVALDEGRR
jgi:hypothetical protein